MSYPLSLTNYQKIMTSILKPWKQPKDTKICSQCTNVKVKLELFLKDTCVLPNWGVIIKRRLFSCLLEEGIANICKKFRFLHNVFNTDGIIIISKLTTYFIAQNRKTVKIKPVNVEENEDCKGKLPMKKIVKTKKKI